MKRVDARGLSCPEPVIQTKNAMASKEAEYEVLVDNVVAKENVSRFVMHQGYQVNVETTSHTYEITALSPEGKAYVMNESGSCFIRK